MKTVIKKIGIQSNWDEKVSWYREIPKNKKEIELNAYNKIVTFLIKNDSGSLIVSGERGVGKTTTVIKAIKNSQKNEGSIFPIYINALYLESINETDSADNLKMQKLLKLLIKSLANEIEKRKSEVKWWKKFFYEKTKGLYKAIKELNKLMQDCDATALSRSIISNSKKASSYKLEIENSFSQKIDLLITKLGNLINNISVNSGLNYSNSNEEIDQTIWRKDGITIEDVVDRFSTIIKKAEEDKILCFKIKSTKRKIVYVIDELDLYSDDNTDNIKDDDILKIIKRFKNLFTLSNAHFIFIVGKDTYLKAKKDPYRTVFSERCFLSIPDANKISNFMDSIINDSSNIPQEWEENKWLLISRSRHNLYELTALINDSSIFNEEKRENYFELTEMSPTEKAIASFHYLLNTVFIYHRQNPAFEHFNDVLFEELLYIEGSFKHFLFNDGKNYNVLMKNVSEMNNEGINTDEVCLAIKEAKESLIKIIFLYLNKEIPKIVDEIVIPWSDLRNNLTFEQAKRGILGIITKSEEEFFKELDFFIESLQRKFSNYIKININYNNLSQYIAEIEKLVNLKIDNTYLSIINSAIEEVYKLTVDKRSPEIMIRARQSLSAINSQFNAYESIKKEIIIKKEWGNSIFEEDKIIFKKNTEQSKNKLINCILIEFPKKENFKKLEIKAKIKLSKDGIINFLFYKDWVPNEIDKEFYMVRYDSRPNYSDCILYKPNKSYWNEIPSTFSHSIKKTKEDAYFEIKITLEKNIITMSKKSKKIYKTIAQAKININCQKIGLSNEINDAEINLESIKYN